VSEHSESPVRTALVPAAAGRPGDDPIFSLNAEATRRAAAGESILNATLGALTLDDGRLAVMPTVAEVMATVARRSRPRPTPPSPEPPTSWPG
jgi:hypothetical protein